MSAAGGVAAPLIEGAATRVATPAPVVISSAISVAVSPIVSVDMVWVKIRRWVGVWYCVWGKEFVHLRWGLLVFRGRPNGGGCMWRQMKCLEPVVIEGEGVMVFLPGKGEVVALVPVILAL